MADKEIDELRKRIDRLEWLISIMRDKQSVDALKGALIDAQRKLEELLKKSNGDLASEPLYLRVQAQRLAVLARQADNRAVADKLRAISGDLEARAGDLDPPSARRFAS